LILFKGNNFMSGIKSFEKKPASAFISPAVDKSNHQYQIAVKDFNNRGIAWRAKKNLNRAIADFTQALKATPDLARAYNNRGEAYSEKGEPDLAIEDFTRAIDLNPDFAAAYNNRGESWYEQGDLETVSIISKLSDNMRHIDRQHYYLSIRNLSGLSSED
jgi:tetratricopeptide (TPR) repeat protein